MKILWFVFGALLALAILAWLGLKVKPAAFPPYPGRQPQLETIALPAGLPTPVERFYRLTYGEQIPVIHTAVVSGRGSMRIGWVRVPIRFRFTHEAGKSFRHDIDLTFFGFKLTQGYERFVDGVGYGRTPGGIDRGEGFDQGSNVSLWAEALSWFPAALLTDGRVRWQAVDDATALLITPFKNGSETFVVRFDPQSGLVRYIEAMKYNSAAHRPLFWVSGVWFDEGRPWLRLDVEDTLYNVDVHSYVTAAEN